MSTRRLRLIVLAVIVALLGAWLVASPAQAASGSVTGKVYGKLAGQPAKPLANARVYLDRLNKQGWHDNADASGTTNANGTFTITKRSNDKALRDGKYQMRIYPPDDTYGYEYYKNKWSPYESTYVTVSGGRVTVDDIVLEPTGWVTGQVFDENNKPLTNTTVMVQDHKNSGGYGFKTDSQGRYDTRDGEWTGNTIPGTYVITASYDDYAIDAKAYTSHSADVTVRPGQAVVQNLKVKQLQTTLFTVKYSDGSPVRTAPVGMWLQLKPGGVFEGAQYGPIETDQNGKFRIVEGIQRKLKFAPGPGYAGTDVAEYWDGPSGTGAYAFQDAAALTWPANATTYRRNYTVTLGAAPNIKQGKATVKGTPKLGAKLKAKTSGWPKNVKLRYEWEKDGTIIKKATKKKLKVTKSIAKARSVSLRVTATRSGDKAVDAVSKKKSIKLLKLKAATPRISGTTKVGKALTAKAGNWGPGKVKLKFQWFKGKKAIKGATSKRLKLTKKLKGKKISVVVTGSRAGYQTVQKKSRTTAKVKR